MQREMTREYWLQQMAGHLTIRFIMAGWSFGDKKYSISCGLPSQAAFSRKYRTVGECWYPEASTGLVHEIFVSPTESDSIQVAAILAHELVHVVVGKNCGHRGAFRKCAIMIGLTGKMTSTEPTPYLKQYIRQGIEDLNLGPYPHFKMLHTKVKKQPTRLIKIECINLGCNFYLKNERPYSLRSSALTLEYGLPFCGSCGEGMSAHGAEKSLSQGTV